MLDFQGKGWLTAPELGEVLADLGHYFHRDHLYLFVRRFDKHNDGRILYSDFCDAITPLSLPHSTLLNSRRAFFIHNNFHRLDFFETDTRALFFRLLKLYFVNEESAELLRKRLNKRPYFNVHEAFSACDSDKNGVITKDELKNLLIEYQFYPTDHELSLLIARYDRNHDGRVSFAEFSEELMPRLSLR